MSYYHLNLDPNIDTDKYAALLETIWGVRIELKLKHFLVVYSGILNDTDFNECVKKLGIPPAREGYNPVLDGERA
jgi:hypothetical protein